MKKLLVMVMLVAPLLYGQHNTKSRWYVDTQDSATGNSVNIWMNVKDPLYAGGAKANAVNDDRLAIQATIDTCSATGGGTVYLPTGVYKVVPVRGHDTELAYSIKYGLRLRSNVHLQGAGRGKTIIKLASGNYKWTNLISNYNSQYSLGLPADSNITVSDLTLDANEPGNHQTSGDTCNSAFGLSNVNHFSVSRVTVQSVSGTTGSGPGESFAMGIGWSENGTLDDVEAIGNPYSSTGISLSVCQNVSISNSRAHDFGIANGIAVWGSRNISITNCSAWGNAGAGIDIESSSSVVVSGNNSGGKTPTFTSPLFAHADSAQGNRWGFVSLSNTGPVWFVGNTGTHNSVNGLVSNLSDYIHVLGGSFDHNGQWGIWIAGLSDSSRASVSNIRADFCDSGAVWFNGRRIVSLPTVGPFYCDNYTDATFSTTDGHFHSTLTIDGFTIINNDLLATGSYSQFGLSTLAANLLFILASDAGHDIQLLFQKGGAQKWLMQSAGDDFVLNDSTHENVRVQQGTGNAIFRADVNAATFNGVSPINLTQDTVQFYSTNARVAKYFPGTVAGDIFHWVAISADGTTSPLAGDFCKTLAKADSCIVIRGASSNTSGMVVGLTKLKP